MKLTFANILMLLLAAVGCTSCIYEYGTEPVDEPEQNQPRPQYPGDVYLNLSVGVLTQPAEPVSRANTVDHDNYFEGPASKFERMNSLRVIIVRGERSAHIPYYPEWDDSVGYVEHNHYYKFNDAGQVMFDNMIFKVRAGEGKKIYLIANESFVEANTGIDFDNIRVGHPYTEDLIEDIQLKTSSSSRILINNSSPTGTYYVPMCESFIIDDLPLPDKPDGYTLEKSFFVTRAAVKFSFIVSTSEDYRDTDLLLKGITVNGIANREYFLPRADYYPEKYTPSTLPFEGRFVDSYRIPDGAAHSSFTFRPFLPLDYFADNVELNNGEPNNSTATSLKGYLYDPAIYFSESKTLDGKYTISATLGPENPDAEENPNDLDYTFPAVELPNLSALPRNTHVIVHLTLTKTELTATVKLVPYIGVTLDPEYGFTDLVPWWQGRPENGEVQPVSPGE